MADLADGPFLKRRRTEDDLTALHPPAGCSDIWFDDGNIVIQAENTQFRVYKGALSRASTVLKEAIDYIGEGKGVEWCPLLFLSDSAAEMAYVLRAIFDRWSYPESEPLPFDIVAAFLRLGRKYEIKPLFDNALARLASAFPSSREAYINTSLMKKSIFFPDSDLVRPMPNMTIRTILLARELDLSFLLPSAFWFVAMRPELLVTSQSSAQGVCEADRNKILLAGPLLRRAHADYLFKWLDEDLIQSPDCTQPPRCRQMKMAFSVMLWKPPGKLPRFSWRSAVENGLCMKCIALGKKHHSEGAERLWNELPSFFGLPPWEKLLVAALNGA
ncbi:hypothetical protein C8R43DRAFT_1079255 [Mycena crocata]|nr:hypothetical protein C8R43DRAFT_1079255 [Mycena crocata]